MQNIVIIGDTHCGHRAGLTPSEYWSNETEGFMGKVARFQRMLWDWYITEIESIKPIDTLIHLGDAIDGKGERSGGTELIEMDRNEQTKMAGLCMDVAEAKHEIMINGTPYHSGKEEDWEAVLADRRGAHYANHEFFRSEGVTFDLKHKVSGSIIPHGRWTAPRRAALWNALQCERGIQPKIDFLIRGHVHYYTLSKDVQRTVITNFALQGWSKYGSRECEGTNDIGFLQFKCHEGQAELIEHIFDMRPFAAEILEFE